MKTQIFPYRNNRSNTFSCSGSLGLVLSVLVVISSTCLNAFAEELAPATQDEVPIELLKMRIKHLSAEELEGEADKWLARLKNTVKKLNDAKEDVWLENQKLKLVSEQADEAEEQGASSAGAAQREVERELELKEREFDDVTLLREERVEVIDRLTVVVDELSAKLGETDEGQEQEAVLEYRRYIDAVEGVQVDVADTHSAWLTVVAWAKSEQGGLRWARHVGEFAAVLAAFWLLSLVLGKLAGKAMKLASGASQILRKFVVNAVRRITLIVGFLIGLSTLEINVAPLIAVIGAAGFVIAFALQNTLSNFASGLLIMLYKPFDIGDFVQTSEVSGKVRSMTLVTTNMITPDNKLLVVPNNELWGKVVTNVTGSSERRVDLVFGIGYGDDIDHAERVLRDVIDAHPMVLDQPESVVAVSELADSSVNFVCRPWVKTEDYWDAYWDITRQVKIRFDAEGISIPFPQRDLHVFTETAPGNTAAADQQSN